jgi:hypothetical protein
VEVDVVRSEAVTAVWRDRHLTAQQPVFVLENLERARLFWFADRGVMTTRDEDRQPVVRADPHLVPVDARVDGFRLTHFVTGGCIGIDAIDPDPTRIAEGDQQVLGRDVRRYMDRAGRQRYRLAVRRERAGSRIDAERRHVMRVARHSDTRRAVARCHIEMPARRMRPGVMHIGRQRDGVAPDQRGSLDVDVILCELGPETGV